MVISGRLIVHAPVARPSVCVINIIPHRAPACYLYNERSAGQMDRTRLCDPLQDPGRDDGRGLPDAGPGTYNHA